MDIVNIQSFGFVVFASLCVFLCCWQCDVAMYVDL